MRSFVSFLFCFHFLPFLSSPSFLISFPFPFFLSCGYLEIICYQAPSNTNGCLRASCGSLPPACCTGLSSISLAGRLPFASALGKLAPLYFPGAWQGGGCPTSTSMPASASLQWVLLPAVHLFSRWIFPSLTESWVWAGLAFPHSFQFAYTNFGESIEGDLHS